MGGITTSFGQHKAQHNLYPVHNAQQLWGYINDKGKLVVSYQYDKTFDFSEGLGLVYQKNECFFLNVKGEKTLSGFVQAQSFEYGRAMVVLKGKEDFCFINPQGQEVAIKNEEFFRNGLQRIRVLKDKTLLFGYQNRKKDTLIPPQYEVAWMFSEGLSVVKRKIQDSLSLIIDTHNRVQFTTTSTPWGYFEEGLMAVVSGQKLGFMNTKGYWVIPPTFDYKSNANRPSFREGLCVLIEQGKFGYIDKKGRWIIPPTHTYAQMAHKGMVYAQTDTQTYLYTPKGKILTQKSYEKIYPNTTQEAIGITKEHTYEVIHAKGKIYPVNFPHPALDYVNCTFKGGLAKVYFISPTSTLIEAYINTKGKVVWVDTP